MSYERIRNNSTWHVGEQEFDTLLLPYCNLIIVLNQYTAMPVVVYTIIIVLRSVLQSTYLCNKL